MPYPPQNPTSAVGSLQVDIRNIENQLRNKADDYQVNALIRQVDALERTIGDVSTLCNELLSRMQTCEENHQKVKGWLEDKGLFLGD